MTQQNRLITPSGKLQSMSYDQSAVNLQSETLIIHGPKPILKKTEAFANHLSKVFTPNQITPSANVMQEVNKVLGETVQSNTPLKRFSKNKIKTIIFALKEGKSPNNRNLTQKSSSKRFYLSYISI